MNNSRDPRGDRHHWLGLIIAAALLTGVAVWILLLSTRFDFSGEPQERPIITFLVAISIGFVTCLFGIYFAYQVRQTFRLGAFIVGVAILLRLILLFSTPIQEVDIYRYLWDGVVASNGVSPFRYAPDEIVNAIPGKTKEPELEALIGAAESDAGIREALSRVHFSNLPTIYPITSQWVFQAAAQTTPAQSSIQTRVRVMKVWLLAFDLGTLVLVISLLALCGKPIGLSVAYGWCPLVLKEIANSGHLDSIAIFFCSLTMYLLLAVIRDGSKYGLEKKGSWPKLILLSVIFALAVGAKIYPVVLAPLVLFAFVRNFGWVKSVASSCIFVLAVAALLSPMFVGHSFPTATNSAGQGTSIMAHNFEATPTDVSPKSQPSDGLETFLRYWEMNDLVFMIVVENLKPMDLATSSVCKESSVVRCQRTGRGLLPSILARLSLGIDFGRHSLLGHAVF